MRLTLGVRILHAMESLCATGLKWYVYSTHDENFVWNVVQGANYFVLFGDFSVLSPLYCKQHV